MWGTKQQSIGLDIGTHSIKLVQVKETKKGYQLLNFGIMPLPQEAIVDGTIMDVNAAAEKIRNLLTSEKVKIKEAVISVSGHAVIVKKIKLPLMSEDQLSESISWEAEQYIPFDIDDVNIDFQILETKEEDMMANQMEIILVAAKKEKINDYTGLILEAGLNPVVVDVDSFALQNVFELNHQVDEKEMVALVNIGASVTNINVLKGNISNFTRDIAVGGNRYTEAIQKELQVGFRQAEALKMGANMAGFSPGKIAPIMVSVMKDLAQEIRRSFEFFRSASTESEIHKIILSGGCACIQGIDRFFTEALNIPTEIIKPFNYLKIPSKQFDPEYLKAMGPIAAVAVGLAIRRKVDR